MKSAIGHRRRAASRGHASLLGKIALCGFVLFSGRGTAASAPLLTCEATPEREVARIPTPDGEGPFDESVFVAISGADDFSVELPYGWQFSLIRRELGWSLHVFDRERSEDRADLSAITPPFHGPANPREIEGWHFRNAANSGPNRGDVNAPQELRLFQFALDWLGPAGDPPVLSTSQSTSISAASEGRGWLRILDYRLTAPEEGERASLQSMTFQACLSWPRLSPAELAEWEQRREAAQRRADRESPHFLDEEREEIGACGLDLSRFALEARILPRSLRLDLDGDDAEDSVFPVRRISDGKPLLALCRAGTWLDLIGPEHPTLDDRDTAHIVGALERWTVVPSNHGAFGYEGEPDWPNPEGDVLVLERIEKGMAIFYWKDEALRSRSLYRFVEP